MLQESTESGKKVIVAVKQGNLLATAFHPELTADTRWYVSSATSMNVIYYLSGTMYYYYNFTFLRPLDMDLVMGHCQMK